MWKAKQLCATYENLLQISCKVTATDIAKTICEVLKSRVEEVISGELTGGN